jgi:hypothetical protein
MDSSETWFSQMTKKIVKVLIGIPDKGITDCPAYDNHLEFMHALGKLQAISGLDDSSVEFNFSLVVIGRVFPALARERMAEHMVESGNYDYLLMWDDDMILPMDMFQRLYWRNVDIIAPLAFTRIEPFKPVIYNLTEGWDSTEKKSYYMNFAVLNYPKNTLVECDAVGFGAVLIKTSVFQKIKKPWFMSTTGSGEDIYFCHQARKAGVRVFMDTSVKLGHLGERIVVTEEIYESQADVISKRKTHEDEVKYGN